MFQHYLNYMCWGQKGKKMSAVCSMLDMSELLAEIQ